MKFPPLTFLLEENTIPSVNNYSEMELDFLTIYQAILFNFTKLCTEASKPGNSISITTCLWLSNIWF